MASTCISRILGVQRVHNDVIELAVELGFVGLVSIACW